jgi:hypothetical protein
MRLFRRPTDETRADAVYKDDRIGTRVVQHPDDIGVHAVVSTYACQPGMAMTRRRKMLADTLAIEMLLVAS